MAKRRTTAELYEVIAQMQANDLPHIYDRLGKLEGKMTVLLGTLSLVASGTVALVVKLLIQP